jgi:lipopolysaccharide biosynthesis glycosyltransferase
VNIVVAFDDAFAKHASAMLASCFRYNAVDRVFAIINDLKPATARRFTVQVQKCGVQCHLLDIGVADLSGFPVFGHVSRMTYARLFALDLLPAGLQRVLYLDCDLVVMGELAELWAIDLESAPVACVVDEGVVEHKGALGMAENSPYFNAGVMLWDIPRLLEQDVMRRARTFLRCHPERVVYWDQDALNLVLEGAWRAVPARWNARFTLDDKSWRSNLALGETPTIVHFAGSGTKPWQVGSAGHPYRHAYARARWLSAWPLYLDPLLVQTPKRATQRLLHGAWHRSRQVLSHFAEKKDL